MLTSLRAASCLHSTLLATIVIFFNTPQPFGDLVSPMRVPIRYFLATLI